MKAKKIGGIYIGELIAGVFCICGIMAALMLAVNNVYPAW